MVMTTHDHLDHNYDLPIIADNIYQYNQQVPTAEMKDIDYLLDEDTHGNFDRDKLKDSHTSDNSPDFLRPARDRGERNDYLDDFGFKLKVFRTKHDDKLPHSVGLVLILFDEGEEKFRIGITSDTKYLDDFPDLFDGCNLVICHVGGVHLPELNEEQQDEEHLGYTGVNKLIRETDAPLYLVTEFWGGKGDIRFPLIKLLKQKNEDDVKTVIGGDIGLMVKLPDGKIRCSRCGSWIAPAEIHTPRPAGDYETMRYLCKECIS